MDDTDTDFRGLVDLVSRRLRLILAVFCAVVGLAGLVTVLLTPLYSATTLILVDTGRTNLLDPETQGPAPGSDNARVDSEVEILRSDAVLLAVIDAERLASDPQFGAAPRLFDRLAAMARFGDDQPPTDTAARQAALEKLKRATRIERRGLTYLVSIAVQSPDAGKAARLANAIADAYIEGQLRARIDGALDAAVVVAARLEEARATIIASQERLDPFISLHAEANATADTLLAAGLLPPDTLTELFALQQAADLARAQYRTLLARGGDLEVQAGLQLAGARIVSRAEPPVKPGFPDWRLNLLLAGLAGLGFGVGLAFIYENFVGGFTSESQLLSVTRRPVVGAVPFSKPPTDAPSIARLMTDAPLSSYAEAIRRLRAGLDRALAGSGTAPVIMVTSATTAEGKTTIALSLARAYAAAGKKTLLIDCDLRQPAVHRHIGLNPDKGLLDYLAAGSQAHSLAAMIMRDEESGLSVLVGARPADIPTDQLITGAAFARLIGAAANSFEMVVLDAPPILPVVDGLYLAQHANAVLFVVKWSSTPQTMVRSALEKLAGAHPAAAPILLALNRQPARRARAGAAADYG